MMTNLLWLMCVGLQLFGCGHRMLQRPLYFAINFSHHLLFRYDKIRETLNHVKQNEARLQQQLQEKNAEIKSSYNQFEVSDLQCGGNWVFKKPED